jgi:hypothetical protein
MGDPAEGPMPRGVPSPLWLRALGVLALAAILGSALFALAIGAANFARIGV